MRIDEIKSGPGRACPPPPPSGVKDLGILERDQHPKLVNREVMAKKQSTGTEPIDGAPVAETPAKKKAPARKAATAKKAAPKKAAPKAGSNRARSAPRVYKT